MKFFVDTAEIADIKITENEVGSTSVYLGGELLVFEGTRREERTVFSADNGRSQAAIEFADRYTRPDGTLIWRERWPGMDGSDDPYEGFMNMPLFYALGGSEEVYKRSRTIWASASHFRKSNDEYTLNAITS